MRAEVEFAAEEQDAGAEVLEATEASGVAGLDEALDLRVEALGEGVRYPDAGSRWRRLTKCALERLGHGFDLGELAAHDGAVPSGVKKRSPLAARRAGPKIPPSAPC